MSTKGAHVAQVTMVIGTSFIHSTPSLDVFAVHSEFE